MPSKWKFHGKVPEDGQQWGKWCFDKKRLALVYGNERYEIDLERIDGSAEMLDWIFQLSNKPGCSRKDIGDLVEAFDDLFYPQANLCSGGSDKKIDATKYFKAFFAQPISK